MSSFTVFVPAVTPQLKYTITGPDCQILSISLQPQEFAEAEPGSLMYMHPDIKTTIRCGKCSRICTGESICIAKYTNGGSSSGYVSLSSALPGSKIIPVDMSTVGGSIIVKSGSYMAAIGDISVEASVDCCSSTCCCGGLGAVRQRVKGAGTAFLTGGGTVLTRSLAPGEKIVVDGASIIGYQESATLGIQRTGGCCTCCCGGEGLFVTTVTGPGLMFLESMSFEKYRRAIVPVPPE